MAKKKKALIIGAGPAGLTAAYELLHQTDIIPVIYEATGDIGGIAKTYNFKENRMDMGGHRFFSKSDRIMNWWLNIFPAQGAPAKDDAILNTQKPFSTLENAPDPEEKDNVMLIRNRLSRIFYLRNFFDYPISLSFKTIAQLGLFRLMKIGFSYLMIKIFPVKKINSLEDFLISRFGKELYNTFFKDYTEKVWGLAPSKIKPDWGAQRIKGLSITKVILHAIKSIFKKKDSSLEQKNTETSLIEQFIYPKFGPGQLWEEVARIIVEKGGEIHLNHFVKGIQTEKNRVTGLTLEGDGKKELKVTGDYVFSTMPVKDLINGLGSGVPGDVQTIAGGLVYRDFITVGLLLKKLAITNKTNIKTINNVIPDLWIYIQERDVKIGRLQVFNNWSPYMVQNMEDSVFVGLEYFANEGDSLWSMAEEDFKKFAIDELYKINIIEKEDVLDSCLVKVPKAYPAYFGTYDQFDNIKQYVNNFENLFLIGRNGMHRYNNMDHSMLTAITAVENIAADRKDKENIWTINTEEEYHENK